MPVSTLISITCENGREFLYMKKEKQNDNVFDRIFARFSLRIVEICKSGGGGGEGS